jgi:glutamyl-tRNA synthetase
VRFKTPQTGITFWHDQIKGHIAFENQELDDLVIRRADGIPTYNFAVVVDDITMRVSHVIRGDDHISNTPRQILIYQALGEEPPLFAHMPLMLGKDRTKLSKRHGALPVLAYRDRGILPQALNNYLARLGWSHGDQEIFSMEELIRYFSLEHVGKAPGIHDDDKLLWLNSHYLKETPPEELGRLLLPFLAKEGIHTDDVAKAARVAVTLNKRAKTLVEMAQAARFYYLDPWPYEEEAARKHLTPAAIPVLTAARERLAAGAELSEEGLTQLLKDLAGKLGVKVVEVAQPLRVALTGKAASPSLTELIPILGREECVRRLDHALRHLGA